MADIMPPPPTNQGETGRTNELSELSAFILDHGEAAFDRHLATLLHETSQAHDAWAANCRTAHFYEDVPCDEFERGVSLGVAWLKARINDGGATNGS